MFFFHSLFFLLKFKFWCFDLGECKVCLFVSFFAHGIIVTKSHQISQEVFNMMMNSIFVYDDDFEFSLFLYIDLNFS